VELIPTTLPDLKLIQLKVFCDERGFFAEQFHSERYRDAGMPGPFVQDNFSYSRQGVLRGLHYQNPFTQGKLVTVAHGEIYDVAVDIRRGSSTFGKSFGTVLSAENGRQLFLPPGFAHGFCVLSAAANVAYKCTAFYHPEAERGVRWSDPALGIHWPVEAPLISPKDLRLPRLVDIAVDLLPS
jgi:dTDP-4-dehydrorhamnose 3,5-epimerase